MKDQNTISNAQHEIRSAAKYLGVDPIVIHVLKWALDTNDRELIYNYIRDNKGSDLGISVRI